MCFGLENLPLTHFIFSLPYLHRCGAQDLSDRHGIDASTFVSYGMAWELLTLHTSMVRMRRSSLRCLHFPRRPGAQVECRNQRLLMLTSAVLETSVATGCHPSGLLPPKAGDNGDVNGLSVSPPSQSLQAMFFAVQESRVRKLFCQATKLFTCLP